MKSDGLTDQFQFSHGFHPNVDFCVWLLEQDGLHASPFDIHTQSTGPLQRAGLHAQTWQEWFARVVTHLDSYPYELWEGDPLLRSLLEARWNTYQPYAQTRRRWEAPLGIKWAQELPNLWQELAAYFPVPMHLQIFLVPYAKALEYIISPQIAIVSIPNEYVASETFRTRILHMGETLFPSAQTIPTNPTPSPIEPFLDESLKKRIEIRTRVINELKERGSGTIKIGKIQQLTSFGAIVNLDGMELNVPTANFELQPGEVIKQGNNVEIQVVKVDQQRQSLFYKFKLL